MRREEKMSTHYIAMADRLIAASERLAAAAQREAIQKYFAPAEGVLDYLKDIRQPT
jgi:hypothetical protein